MENEKKDGFVIITREYQVCHEYAGMDIVATTTSLKKAWDICEKLREVYGKDDDIQMNLYYDDDVNDKYAEVLKEIV